MQIQYKTNNASLMLFFKKLGLNKFIFVIEP